MQHVDRDGRQDRHDRPRRRDVRVPRRAAVRAVGSCSTRRSTLRALPSDDEAQFDLEHRIDVTQLAPQVTWGTNPEQVIPIDGTIPDPVHERDPERRREMELRSTIWDLRPGLPIAGTPIDWVFIGSCANSRISDLRAAAQSWRVATSRRRSRPGWFRVRRACVARRRRKGSIVSSPRPASSGESQAARCAWPPTVSAWSGPALGVDVQPQFRRPPGPGARTALPAPLCGSVGAGGCDHRRTVRSGAAMRPFTTLAGTAVPVDRANVDTDVLIPINRLIGTPPAELGRFLFEPWRYLPDGAPDPEFPLNQPRFAGAEVLVAGENFGCGSSREHAVWALASFGIRCVVAPTFGDIFRQNCFQNGVLPVALPNDVVAALVARAADRRGADRECRSRSPDARVPERTRGHVRGRYRAAPGAAGGRSTTSG